MAWLLSLLAFIQKQITQVYPLSPLQFSSPLQMQLSILSLPQEGLPPIFGIVTCARPRAKHVGEMKHDQTPKYHQNKAIPFLCWRDQTL